jgi:eukaryotic-like serine/threonine-protein kinase
MIELARTDDELTGLVGLEIRSGFNDSVSYRIDRLIGSGGMSVAFLALRVAPEGICPVVLKFPRPSTLGHGSRAELTMRKEAVALGRLNERVPPTPFVVRLIETDAIRARIGGIECKLPWLSVEYVHGGAEGTTLEKRVKGTVERTGEAFDPERAALAIDCMCKGISAAHDVGVFHRDLTPHNILCCGFGDAEIFKIVDFGAAKPVGMTGTFGNSMLGTPGYAAPEQMSADGQKSGPWSDIFSLGCLVYFVLTAEDYFPAGNFMQSITAPLRPERRSITEVAALSSEIRGQPSVCRTIDETLARATAAEPERRLASAQVLATMIVPLLRTESRGYRSRDDRVRAILPTVRPPVAPKWQWTVAHRPGGDRIIRSAAWDSDGHCLVATTRGLQFWNGIEWLDAPTEGLSDPGAVRFVHRMSAGRWLVGGDGATLAVLSNAGVIHILRRPDATVQFSLANGEIDDLAILVGSPPGLPLNMYTVCGGRWFKPLPLPHFAAVTSIGRLDDMRWLLAGRTRDATGFVAIATPTDWDVSVVATPATRALLSCAGHRDRGTGTVVGTEGTVVHMSGVAGVRESHIGGAGDLASAAVDLAGTEWAGGAGQIWTRLGSDAAQWQLVWQDSTWTAPVVGLFADVGMVLGLTVDGGVIEGRLEGAAFSPRRSRP